MPAPVARVRPAPRRLAALILAGLGASACDVGFEPLIADSPSFAVSVRGVHQERLSTEVRVRHAGSTGAPEVTVAGRRFPAEPTGPGAWDLLASVEADSLSPALRFELRPTNGPAVDATVPLVARNGPVTWEGSELRIALTRPDAAPDQSSSWRLTLTDPAGVRTIIDGFGWVPDTLRIDASLVPPGTSQARLNIAAALSLDGATRASFSSMSEIVLPVPSR